MADPGALRAVLSAGIGLAAIAVVGVALGAIIRHTAGAVAALPPLIYLPLEGTPADLVAARFTLAGEHLAAYVGT